MTLPLNTAPLSCPGCTRQGSLTLLQEGRTSPVPGLKDRPPLYGCLACPWQGWGNQLEEPGGVNLEGIRVDIQACWDEQEHMEVAGGGGGCKAKRQPKPGDKEMAKRIEQEPPAGTRDKSPSATLMEKRVIVRTFRLTPSEDALLHIVAAGLKLDLRDTIVSALQEVARKA